MVIAVLKNYASKFNIKKITVSKEKGTLELPSIESLANKGLQASLDKYASETKLNMSQAPVIEFIRDSDPAILMAKMTKFLKFAITFASL